MPEKNFIREYQLVFVSKTERVELNSIGQKTPLDISFRVTYDPEKVAQGRMELSVFGLKESNVAKISKEGVKVFLNVGYRNSTDLTRLYTGEVVHVEVFTPPGKHETKIKCRTSKLGSKPLLITYPAGVTHSSRIATMIGNARTRNPGLITKTALDDLVSLNLDEPLKSEAALLGIPDRTLLSDDVIGSLTTDGTVLDELTDYCKETFNIVIAVVNDELRLVRLTGGKVSGNDRNRVDAILGQNLLSPPRRKMDNLEGAVATKSAKVLYDFKMLMSPQINMNTVVVSNTVRNDTGTVDEKPLAIKVVKIVHTGKMYGKKWYTDISGYENQKYIRKTPVESVEDDFFNPADAIEIF